MSDIDELINEIESSHRKVSITKQPKTIPRRTSEIDSILSDLTSDSPYIQSIHPPQASRKPSLLKCTRLDLITCDSIRCLSCDFKVLKLANRDWTKGNLPLTSVDYMFFRNAMPNLAQITLQTKRSGTLQLTQTAPPRYVANAVGGRQERVVRRSEGRNGCAEDTYELANKISTMEAIEQLKQSLEQLSQTTGLFQMQASESERIYQSKAEIKTVLYKSAVCEEAQKNCVEAILTLKAGITDVSCILMSIFSNHESEISIQSNRIDLFIHVTRV